MMNNKITLTLKALVAAFMVTAAGCTRDISTDTLASYPQIQEVFLDGFAPDLQFQAWGKVTNFSIDAQTQYEGTTAMKIEVPAPNDPLGSWAGGTFYSTTGRDLTGYDALVLYAKASVPTSVEVGLGNYGNADYLVSVKDVALNHNWKQIIIPIPNAAKLVSEEGLFYYSAGAVDGEGYTIWFDEVQFAKLELLAHARIDDIDLPGFPGSLNIGKLTETVNLPNGVNQQMEVTPNYFNFETSDPEVVSVEDNVLTVHKSGKAVITLKEAQGSINVECYDYAPTPEHPAAGVVSLFSDSYENRITANWNPRWEWSTAEFTEIESGTNHIAYYSGLNFVGIVFDDVADCSAQTHLHLDLLCTKEINAGSEVKIEVHTKDGSSMVYTVTQASHPDFTTRKWLSADFPLTGGTRQIAQLVLASNVDNLLLDNIYFH